ncbi:MAG: chromosomal replication initiator protein DnaA [Deltaproteobacteria bacterium]|nr:chromosomal replication initiator protein DnaA [Deltaproteobacteria bacterium]
MKTVWGEIKNQIKMRVPENTFSLWIKPIACLQAEKNSVVLGCPNRFSKDWVVENYLDLIREKFNALVDRPVDVQLKVQRRKRTPSPAAFAPDPDQLILPGMPEKKRPKSFLLNSQFTFDRFIVGQSNEFAYSASKNIALGDSCDYHSLLMLSNTGLGKTHLSQAIGHSILAKNPRSRVFYMTAEDFTNEMISSLRNRCIEAFKNRYRQSCDVLLLEEVHFLGGKEKIQAELGYTLDALAQDRKRIIFTSSLPPKDIPQMSKELSSRLTSGLVTTIGGPDYHTRIKILEEKAKGFNVVLSKDVVHFLAGRLKRDVRQMESALKCLKARAELVGAKIDMDLAKDVVCALVSEEGSITTEKIMALVCEYYKVSIDMLSSRSRKKAYAYPRNIYAYLSRKYSDETLESIGRTINRSHSTVVYATELVEKKMKTDRSLKHQVGLLKKHLDESLS